VEFSREFPSGAEFERLRKEAGLSRVQLSRRVLCDPSSIYNLEHDREVSDRLRLLVLAALGQSVFSPIGAVTAL